MFEAGKEVCWPVTWEMVAPELGEVRSFIAPQLDFSSMSLSATGGTLRRTPVDGVLKESRV